MNALMVKSPAPTKVVRQIARGHTPKGMQPAMKAAVVRVHVLHVDGAGRLAGDLLAHAHIDEVMCNARFFGKSAAGFVAIGNEQGVRRQDGRYMPVQLRLGERAASGDEVPGAALRTVRESSMQSR